MHNLTDSPDSESNLEKLRLKISCIPKLSLIAYINMEIAIKMTLQLGFGRPIDL